MSTTSLNSWSKRFKRRPSRQQQRQGVILILSAFVLAIMFCLAAFAVDLGYLVLVRAQLQNAADASALGAVLELGATVDVDEAREAAIDEAVKIAAMNKAAGSPVALIPDGAKSGATGDVLVGLREFSGGSWSNDWGGAGPYNIVLTKARRNNPNRDAPDGQLDLFFANFITGWRGGGEDKKWFEEGFKTYGAVSAEARAMLSPRDLVFVIDRSGSMNFDTYENLGATPENIQDAWDTLIGNASPNSGGLYEYMPHQRLPWTSWNDVPEVSTWGVTEGDGMQSQDEEQAVIGGTGWGNRTSSDALNGDWRRGDTDSITGSNQQTAVWTFTGLTPGTEYEIYASWQGFWRYCDYVPYYIYDTGTFLTTGVGDHTRDADPWEANGFLATVTPATSTIVVAMWGPDATRIDDPEDGNGGFSIDGMRIVEKGDPQSKYETLYQFATEDAYLIFDGTVPVDPTEAENADENPNRGGNFTSDNFVNTFLGDNENYYPNQSAGEPWNHYLWWSYSRYMFGQWSELHVSRSHWNWSNFEYRMGQRTFLMHLMVAGYMPAFKGQKYEPVVRLSGNANNTPATLPRPIINGDEWMNFYTFNGGTSFVFNSAQSYPIDHVRQAALSGILAMEENSLPDSEVFDQAGYVSYGSLASKDVLLSSDLLPVKRQAANIFGSGRGHPGNTNIEHGIVLGTEVLTEDAGSRPASTKVMALLTDGVANHYTNFGSLDDESDDTYVNGSSTAKSRAITAAENARDAGVRIHSIALGNGADQALMQQIADIGGGTFFYVNENLNVDNNSDGQPDTVGEQLAFVFVAIAKDRLGQLFR